MTQLHSDNSNSLRSLVTFRLDQRTYALPVEPIAQIIEMVTITPILEAEDSVEGVINVRGEPVPVVNLRCHFGLPGMPFQLNTPIILAQIDGRVVGLIVDTVVDVLSLSAGQIACPADIMPEGLVRPPVLEGVAFTSNGAVLLLDAEHLFPPSQLEALAAITEALPQMEGEEALVELPVEAEPEPTVDETPQEPPAEAKAQPTRSRRKRGRRTKAAASESPEEPPSETEAEESSKDETPAEAEPGEEA